MNKAAIEREIESRCRTAINYSSYRCAFFFKLNIALCFLSLISLWCSGFVFKGGYEIIAMILNVAGSLLLILDVILNLLGCYASWKSMHDGYESFLSEFTKIHITASVADLQNLLARFFDYDKRCHATYYALGLIAWNDTCVQMGKPQCVKKVPWYKRLTANVLSWGSVASNFK